MRQVFTVAAIAFIHLTCEVHAQDQQSALTLLQDQIQELRSKLDANAQDIADLKNSALPSGSIFFVQTTNCPKSSLEFVAARGRAIVGSPSPGTVAAQVGPEMIDKEPRNKVAYHQHSITIPPHIHTIPGLVTFDYNEHPPSQIAGGHGFLLTTNVNGTTLQNTAQQLLTDFNGIQNEPALPYIQLKACIKN